MKVMNLKHLRFFQSLLLSFILVLLAACSTSDRMKLETHSTDASADFKHLKTYRWDFSALAKIQPDGGHYPEFDRVVCDHVDKHLAELGYTRVNSGTADFTLDYRVVINQKQAAADQEALSENNQQANPYGLRWSFDQGEKPSFDGLKAPKDQTVIYQSGELHLAAFNQQGQAIWHESITRIIKQRGNEAERRAAVRIAVDKIMKDFPAEK